MSRPFDHPHAAQEEARHYQSLVAAIIEQAASDVKECRLAGVIKGNLAVQGRQREARVKGSYQSTAEVMRLIHFFTKGWQMDRWISIADLKINGDAIRQALFNQPKERQ